MLYACVTVSFLLAFSLSGLACKENPPTPPYVPTIFLSADDVGVTDAWLKITRDTPHPTQDILLKRDGQTIFSDLRFLTSDTLIADDSLFPKQTYTYKVYALSEGTLTDSSDLLTITTMDTTSHNFTWEIDTLGDGNSSVLYDVTIVNDTLVYAVGEIYKRDSTGQFENEPYGLAIWNGIDWKLKKLYYRISSGDTIVLSNIRGILYVSSSEIWFAAGSIFRWDGVSPITLLSFSRLNLPDPNATIEKLWGTSNTNLYGVGNAGTIVQYTGT
jgi:hypothetical protein